MQKYNKLVRDNIPDIIRSNGERPVTRKLSATEYKKELLKKLQEEAKEVFEAKGKLETVKELSDVQEVLAAIYKAFDIACGDVTKMARKRRKERGAFTKKIFLERTE